MGIIKQPPEERNIFVSKYGFETTRDGYERCFRCGPLYFLWVTIGYDRNWVKYTIDRSYGGEHKSTVSSIPPHYTDEDIINMVDEDATHIVESLS